MLSTRVYTACNQIDLQLYYSKLDNPLLCRFCLEKDKKSILRDYLLADGRTHWYFCPHCDGGFAGTGTEYLAKVNKLELGDQINKLAKKGFIPPVESTDIQKFLQFKNVAAEVKNRFIAAASFRREASVAFADLYDLDYYQPSIHFRQDTPFVFEKMVRPSIKAKYYNTSSTRLFKGKWKKVTAIPLYDLPLHLSGFLFVNGHDHGEQTHVLRRLGPFAGKQKLFDPGFLGPQTLYYSNPTAVVLCPQWELTLSLQSAIFRQEKEYAPLLGWFPADPNTGEPNTYCWTGLKNIPKIFWSTPDDVANLREACSLGEMVSCAHFNSVGLFAPPSKIYSSVLRSIIKSAEPWHKALTWYLEGDTSLLQEKLIKLKLPPRVLEKYFEHAPIALRNKLADRIIPISPDHARYIDETRILSNIDGWQKLGHGLNRSLLSNTRCVINKVIHIADAPPVYQGKVLIGDEEYPFTEKEDTFEKYPIPTVKKVCVDHNCTQFVRINIKNDAYLRLVKETSAPETVYRKEGYGWSKKESSLLLPNVIISDTTVTDTRLCLQTGPLHKMTVKQDKPLERACRTALANFQKETPIVFSILSAIIPPLFASAYRMHPPQTVITGGDFMLVKQVCDMLGLPQMSIKHKTEIEQYLTVHRCPFLTRTQPVQKKRVIHDWADLLGIDTPALVWTSVTEALARMVYGQANLLLLPNTRFYRWFDGKLPEIFQDSFMQCLKHVSRYVLDPVLHTDDWNDDLIKETFRFFEEEIGVAPAENALFGGYYAQADYFYDYINLLYRAEMINLTDGQKISVAELAECCRQHVGIFDFDQIYELLQRNEAVVEYDVKKQILVIQTEKLLKSNRRLEKFYGTLLRN